MTGALDEIVFPRMCAAFIDIVQRLLPVPTAPYHEHHVIAEILRFASERSLTVEADEFGNLSLAVGGTPKAGLCLTAHLDHPALGEATRESARDILFEKLGGIPTDLARDAPVLLYDTAPQNTLPEPIGRGSVTAFLEEGIPGSSAPCPAFRVRVEGDVPEVEMFAVWDLTPFALKGERIVGRACDDLVGVCVALATLENCLEQGAPLSVLLTRAEETGFGGMLAAVETGRLDTDTVYVNIECSSCRAGAPLGEGPVIRVGDRRWIFDAGVTEALCACAEKLTRTQRGFHVQRRLMDGGVCEATPLSRSGRVTGAVALPLDNYHNHGGDRLQPEAVHLGDAENLVALLTQLALQPQGAAAFVDDSVSALDHMLAARRQPQLERLRRRMARLP